MLLVLLISNSSWKQRNGLLLETAEISLPAFSSAVHRRSGAAASPQKTWANSSNTSCSVGSQRMAPKRRGRSLCSSAERLAAEKHLGELLHSIVMSKITILFRNSVVADVLTGSGCKPLGLGNTTWPMHTTICGTLVQLVQFLNVLEKSVQSSP